MSTFSDFFVTWQSLGCYFPYPLSNPRSNPLPPPKPRSNPPPRSNPLSPPKPRSKPPRSNPPGNVLIGQRHS